MRNVKDLLICYSSFVDLSVWFNDYEGRSEMFSCVIVCFGEHFQFQLMGRKFPEDWRDVISFLSWN